MQNPLLQNHPFLRSNILTTRDSGGNESYYNFVVDLIASNRSINDVQSFPGFHEVIHRVSSNYGAHTNSFTLLRQIAGLSHALIMHLIVFINKNDIRLKGQKFSGLEIINGSIEQNETIKSIIQRILYIESIFDMGWRAIIPIAELLAIDFSYDLQPNNYFYNGWNLDKYFQVMGKNKDVQSKLGQLKYSIRNFPENFGGYEMKYGSFSKAMEKTFFAYNSIDDNAIRFPILDLALHVLYLDEKDQVMVDDPIEMLMKVCSDPLRTKREEFLKKLARLRIAYGSMGQRLVKKLTKDLLFDLSEDIFNYKNLTLGISNLMLEQKQGDLDHIHSSMFIDWVETLSRSFIRMDLIEKGTPSIAFNPNYLIAAHYRICKHLNIETTLSLVQKKKQILDDPYYLELWEQLNLQPDWWRRLALLESLRHSLKSGQSPKCPFVGLKIKEISDNEIENNLIRCSDKCIIRSWLIKLADNTEIIDSNSICDP